MMVSSKLSRPDVVGRFAEEVAALIQDDSAELVVDCRAADSVVYSLVAQVAQTAVVVEEAVPTVAAVGAEEAAAIGWAEAPIVDFEEDTAGPGIVVPGTGSGEGIGRQSIVADYIGDSLAVVAVDPDSLEVFAAGPGSLAVALDNFAADETQALPYIAPT